MAQIFRIPGSIITGAGSLDKAGEASANLGSRALICTGRSAARRSGATGRLVKSLKAEGLEVFLFEQVEPEPSIETVDSARDLLCSKRCDVVIGLGGGSALDVGKAAAGLAFSEFPTEDYHQGKVLPDKGLPFVAIPTTSGTGSEATWVSVLIDPKKRLKKSIRGEALMPRVAIVDAELTISLSPEMTAYSGMDAFTQAVESFLSIYASPLTEALSLEAVRLIGRSLVKAFQKPLDLGARSDLSYGSLMAGMALQNARLGVVHGVAHPIGGRFPVPHGLACALLLPRALELNRDFAREKYARLAEVLGEEPVAYTWGLLEKLELPRDLSEFGVSKKVGADEEDFDAMIKEALASGSTKANPRPIKAEDVRWILERVAGGGGV